MLKDFKYAIILTILLIAFLSFQDVQGFKMFKTVGPGYGGETFTKMESSYMTFFWVFAYGLIAVAAAIYYMFRKDLSETLALVLSYIWLIMTGAEDLLYYIFRGIPLDATMPWLNNKWAMITVAGFMGSTTVTSSSLIVSVLIGVIGVYIIVKVLSKINYSTTIGGVHLRI